MFTSEDMKAAEIEMAQDIEDILQDYHGQLYLIVGRKEENIFFTLSDVYINSIRKLPQKLRLKEYKEENLDGLAKAYKIPRVPYDSKKKHQKKALEKLVAHGIAILQKKDNHALTAGIGIQVLFGGQAGETEVLKELLAINKLQSIKLPTICHTKEIVNLLEENDIEYAQLMLDDGFSLNHLVPGTRGNSIWQELIGSRTQKYTSNKTKIGIETIQFCLEKGVNLEARYYYQNEYALHLAAGAGDEELVGLLLEYGTNLNAVDENGKTALEYALEYAPELDARTIARQLIVSGIAQPQPVIALLQAAEDKDELAFEKAHAALPENITYPKQVMSLCAEMNKGELLSQSSDRYMYNNEGKMNYKLFENFISLSESVLLPAESFVQMWPKICAHHARYEDETLFFLRGFLGLAIDRGTCSELLEIAVNSLNQLANKEKCQDNKVIHASIAAMYAVSDMPNHALEKVALVVDLYGDLNGVSESIIKHLTTLPSYQDVLADPSRAPKGSLPSMDDQLKAVLNSTYQELVEQAKQLGTDWPALEDKDIDMLVERLVLNIGDWSICKEPTEWEGDNRIGSLYMSWRGFYTDPFDADVLAQGLSQSTFNGGKFYSEDCLLEDASVFNMAEIVESLPALPSDDSMDWEKLHYMHLNQAIRLAFEKFISAHVEAKEIFKDDFLIVAKEQGHKIRQLGLISIS